MAHQTIQILQSFIHSHAFQNQYMNLFFCGYFAKCLGGFESLHWNPMRVSVVYQHSAKVIHREMTRGGINYNYNITPTKKGGTLHTVDTFEICLFPFKLNKLALVKKTHMDLRWLIKSHKSNRSFIRI